MPEGREAPAIGRARVVGEVASHALPQPFPLLWNQLMHPTPSLRLHVPQLSPHAVASGLPLKLEVAAARSTTDEGEAQEREGFRLSKPAQLAIVHSKAAELNQASLVRVERQCKFPKPVMHRIKEATCVALMLKADHQVSGAGGSHPRALAEPYVTLSRHTAPIVRPRPKSRSQWANSPVWRRAMRSSQWMAPVLCLRKDLNFRSAHRARKTSMCLRVG